MVTFMAGAGCWYAMATQQPRSAPVAPSSIVPKNTVLFLQFDGVNTHLPAIKQTAKWHAFEESGLRARVFDIAEVAASLGGPSAATLAGKALDNFHQYGMSLGIAMTSEDQPSVLSPYGVLVLHGAAELKHDLISMLSELGKSMRLDIKTYSKSGRPISIAMPSRTPLPGMELALWEEEEHLVVAAGINASDRVIAILEGTAPSVVENDLFASIRAENVFTVSQLGWFDLQTLVKSLETLPLPLLPNGQQTEIHKILEVLGLVNLQAITMSSGYHGKATWDRVNVIAPEPRKGLLALINQRKMTIEELPPLPANADTFFATTFNIAEAVDITIDTVRRGLSLMKPQGLNQFDQGLEGFNQLLGAPRDVLSSGLGDVFCVYSEPGMLPLGISPVLTASVRDREALTRSLDMLSQIPRAVPNLEGLRVRKQDKEYGTVYSVVIPNVPLAPTILVSNDWFLASMTPGAVQAHIKRRTGRLASWKPGPEHQQAMSDLPADFWSILVMDPRPEYTQLMSFVPMGLSFLETTLLPALSERSGVPVTMPFDMDNMPVPEEITEPMFPNVNVGFTNSSGATLLSRNSVPATPFGSVGSTAVVPIMAALLLPAVQQAREAARRTQSKNNLRQLALGMHNYHDAYGAFPAGTVKNERLAPEERLGWAVSILPFIEALNAYRRVDMKAGWNDQDDVVSQLTLSVYRNPSMPRDESPAGDLDYLGVAGIGPNAASLKNHDPNAGIFGYNRRTRIRDITDGTSHTMMIADSVKPNPYTQGHLTIRGFSEKPYINGPDGIGSSHSGGMQAAFADGSVRFISESIDPTVLEALATKAGGEVVGQF